MSKESHEGARMHFTSAMSYGDSLASAGGGSVVSYLQRILETTLFPELWRVRTQL